MSLPMKATFHRVGITVTNLEPSIEWYDKVFGIKPAFSLLFSGSTGGQVLRLHCKKQMALSSQASAFPTKNSLPTR